MPEPKRTRHLKGDKHTTISMLKGGKRICKAFNDGRGCKGGCGAEHVCDVKRRRHKDDDDPLLCHQLRWWGPQIVHGVCWRFGELVGKERHVNQGQACLLGEAWILRSICPGGITAADSLGVARPLPSSGPSTCVRCQSGRGGWRPTLGGASGTTNFAGADVVPLQGAYGTLHSNGIQNKNMQKNCLELLAEVTPVLYIDNTKIGFCYRGLMLV